MVFRPEPVHHPAVRSLRQFVHQERWVDAHVRAIFEFPKRLLPEYSEVREQAIIGCSLCEKSQRFLELDRLQREKSIENFGLDDILWILRIEVRDALVLQDALQIKRGVEREHRERHVSERFEIEAACC